MHHVIATNNKDKFHELCKQPLTLDQLVGMVMSTDTYYIIYVIEHKCGDLFINDKYENTLLFYASAPVIPVLLNYGLNVNHRNMYNQNTLYSLDDDYNRVCILINSGIDINNIDDDDDTSLIETWDDESFRIVELLLEHGAVLTDNADELLKVVYCMHHQCRQLKQQLNDYLEQTKDLTMFKDFYELCNF